MVESFVFWSDECGVFSGSNGDRGVVMVLWLAEIGDVDLEVSMIKTKKI